MPGEILFSIVTVTRDDADGLRATCRSIARQTFTDFEWLVVDGASVDGTVDFLRGLDMPQLAWTSEPDSGIYDAMNRGVERARGAYVLFLNGGDALAAPETLAAIRQALNAQEFPPGFIYGDALEERPGGTPVRKPARAPAHFRHGMVTHHQAMLYRRAAIGPLRFDTGYRIAADFKFTAQFLLQSPRRLYLPMPLCLFAAGGISQRRVRLGRGEQFRIRRELGLAGELTNRLIYARQTMVMLLRRWLPGLYWRLRVLPAARIRA